MLDKFFIVPLGGGGFNGTVLGPFDTQQAAIDEAVVAFGPEVDCWVFTLNGAAIRTPA